MPGSTASFLIAYFGGITLQAGYVDRRSTGGGAHARASAVRAPERRRVAALDGVRVLAILAVVLYHANVTMFPGGFVGVTIFFVISGYLITDSIIRELAYGSGGIDLKRFYGHRLRRLWPSMVMVILAVAILSAIFAPVLLDKMRPDAVPAALFFNNWWYIFRQLSYFEAAGQPSPLTHFWYLAVIGQFYLVWPLIMWGLRNVLHRKKAVRRAVFVIGLASFVLSVVLFDPNADPSRVYYGTDTRFVEIMVGAWLAFVCPLNSGRPRRIGDGGVLVLGRELPISKHIATDALGIACIAGLVAMCFNLNGYSSTLFRGMLLFAAAITAALIFSLVANEGLLSRFLGLKAFQVGGARSYAVYLWHYPLLLIMNPATRTTALPWWGWVLEFAIIVGVSELSYRFIEEKTAHGQIGEFFAAVRSRNLVLEGRKRVTSIAFSVFAVAGIVLLAIGPVWVYAQQAAQQEYEAQNVLASRVVGDFMPGFDAKSHPVRERLFRNLNRALNGESFFTVDPVTGATDAKVLVIGDSMVAQSDDAFYSIFPNGYLDGKVGRQLSKGPEVYESVIASGYDPEIVVFALGTNGVATEQQVKDLFDCVGGRPVYIINQRIPAALQDMNNSLYPQVVAQYPNAHIIDWYTFSQGHDDWMEPDGTHVKMSVKRDFYIMVRNAVVGS